MAPDFQELAKNYINGGRPGTLTFDRAYRAHFEVSPQISLQIWLLIQDLEPDISFRPKHLLWTLFFLKTYPTEEVGSSRWGVTPKTFREWIWKMINPISQLSLLESYEVQS